MTSTSTDLEDRLARFVEHHVMHGERLPIERLCEGRPELVEPLSALIRRYLSLTESFGSDDTVAGAANPPPGAMPRFEGFETIERIGGGGMGEVYKLRDLTLNRIVAGKIVRRDRKAAFAAFLQEARTMALFSDRRIVRVFEFRDGDPALIVMEHVDGFELGHIVRELRR